MAEKKIICPLMQSVCIEDGEIVNGELHACKFWIKVTGKHPQSGAEVDHFDCAHAWMPILLIDNTQRQRETGAAVESFRNVMTEQNMHSMGAMQTLANAINQSGQALLGNSATIIDGDKT